jgi:hypothetical protein
MVSRRLSKLSRGSRSARTARRLVFEALDARDLLATLTVGASGQFATIQGAVNSAASGDEIALEATALNGDFAESVNLSLMGSAVGGSPGDLTIRGFDGSTGTTTITPAGGPAFFNSTAFNGNLTLQNLILRPATATAGKDAGLSLVNYSGTLKLNEVDIYDAADVGIEITNSSGSFVFTQLEVRRNDSGVTPLGIRLANYAGSGYMRGVAVSDMLQTSIVVEASGSTQTTVGIIESTIGGTGGGETVGNDGVRVLGSGSAVINANIAGNNFDELPGNSIEVIAADSSQVNARIHQNTIVNSESVVRIAGEAAVKLVGSQTSRLNLDVESNTIGGVLADSITVQGLNTTKINATIVDNLLTNVGSAGDHEGILIFGDTAANATINALIANNPIVSPFGSGIRVMGHGSSTYNVSIHDNFIFFSNPNETGVPVFGNDAAGISAESFSSNPAKLNLRITGNEIALPTDSNVTKPASIRIRVQSSAPTFKAEYTGSSLGAYLVSNNTLDGAQPVLASAIGKADIGTFLPTMPLVVGDMIWNDVNKNGLRDDTEPGVFGAVMTLTGVETVSGQSVTRTVISDGEGGYSFGGMLPGAYTVTLTPPVGLDLTSYNRGQNEQIDSDFRQGIRQATITLVAGSDNRDLDAGLIPTDGHIWKNQILAEDVNDDGAVTPLDALLVIIDLNANGPRTLPAPTAQFTPQPFLDVDGRGDLGPLDALLVIIRLNAGAPPGSSEGEPASNSVAAPSGANNSPLSNNPAAPSARTNPLLPPEYFAGNQSTSPASSSAAHVDDEPSALDAFFAEY